MPKTHHIHLSLTATQKSLGTAVQQKNFSNRHNPSITLIGKHRIKKLYEFST